MRKTTQKEDKRQGMDKNENREMIEAVAALAKEKNISKELLFSAIEEALKSAYKNNFSKEYGMPPSNANVRVELNRETGAVRLYARKTVERWPTDEATEISIEEAQAIQPSYQQDDIVEVEVTPDNFRRVAAQTAKQVIVQKIREAERGKVYDDFIEKENEILTAIVHSVDPETKDVYVELGKTEGVLEPSQQMASDVYAPGERFKVYVLEVVADRRLARPGAKHGPQVSVSRIHPGLVKRLFELEVPEIQSGIVQIKSISREAGSRTKMAVHSTDPMIDPVGSCVGPRGQRVDRVVTELRGETMETVEGNVGGEVVEKRHELTDEDVFGFGALPQDEAPAGVPVMDEPEKSTSPSRNPPCTGQVENDHRPSVSRIFAQLVVISCGT